MMEFIDSYNLTGLVIGISTFLIIGLFHPVVIKCESVSYTHLGRYCFGYRCFTDQGVLARFQSIYESRPGFERFGRRDFGRIDVDFTGYNLLAELI